MNQSSITSYLRNMIKDPSVASIAPTSKYGIETLLSGIDLSGCKLMVEYGPGGGVITKHLLEKLPGSAALLVIETNPTFADSLKNEIKDPRLVVKTGSAENVQDYINELRSIGMIADTSAQYIVSGIPFSMFPLELKDRILSATKAALENGGAFLVYQFLVSLSVGKSDIRTKLREYFTVTRSEVELVNIPPLRIFEARKM